MKKCACWAALWREKSKLDGKVEHLLYEFGVPKLFHTRSQSRLWIDANYGYLRTRPDLKAEPFGWKMPIPVRVVIDLEAPNGKD